MVVFFIVLFFHLALWKTPVMHNESMGRGHAGRQEHRKTDRWANQTTRWVYYRTVTATYTGYLLSNLSEHLIY